MSVAVATTLVCDRCGAQTEDVSYGVGTHKAEIRRARREAKEHERWVVRYEMKNGVLQYCDYCAKCATALDIS